MDHELFRCQIEMAWLCLEDVFEGERRMWWTNNWGVVILVSSFTIIQFGTTISTFWGWLFTLVCAIWVRVVCLEERNTHYQRAILALDYSNSIVEMVDDESFYPKSQ